MSEDTRSVNFWVRAVKGVLRYPEGPVNVQAGAGTWKRTEKQLWEEHETMEEKKYWKKIWGTPRKWERDVRAVEEQSKVMRS